MNSTHASPHQEPHPQVRKHRQVALITGACGAVGAELAQMFAGDGFDLVLVGHDRTRLAEIAAALGEGCRTTCIEDRLVDPAAADSIYAATTAAGLVVDTLVNDAGAGVLSNDGEVTDAEMELLELNVVSLIRLTRLYLGDMLSRGHGRIVQLTSAGTLAAQASNGMPPSPRACAFAATTAFVRAFSSALAYELRGTGVTVTALHDEHPGLARSLGEIGGLPALSSSIFAGALGRRATARIRRRAVGGARGSAVSATGTQHSLPDAAILAAIDRLDAELAEGRQNHRPRLNS